ncbi:hypothetical protein D1872_262390 [compost metagenome]
MNKLQPVHDRHFDIRNDEIGRNVQRKFQRFLAIRCFTNDIKSVFLPIKHGTNANSHQQFVIDDHQFIHENPPISVFIEYTALYKVENLELEQSIHYMHISKY